MSDGLGLDSLMAESEYDEAVSIDTVHKCVNTVVELRNEGLQVEVTRSLADWYVRTKGEIEYNRKALEENYKRQLSSLDHKEQAVDNKYAAIIRHWAEENCERGKKFVQLNFGRIQFRRIPESIKVLDKAAALAWFKDNKPGLVRETVVEDLMPGWKDDIDFSHVDVSTGEVRTVSLIPGVVVEPERVAMKVEVGV